MEGPVAERIDEQLRLRATLASIAPGTPLRDGLERILRGRTGALIVLGLDKVVESISTGGFTLDVPFTATGLRELAKMDGAIVIDKDITRIHRAAVHLMPDHTIPSEETGTRHRTAERVAKQTGPPRHLGVAVDADHRRLRRRHPPRARGLRQDPVPRQPGPRHPRALQAPPRRGLRAPCRRSRSRTSSRCATSPSVAQRLEMVIRIAREIEDYVLELGTDGRLLSLQLEELVTGVDAERELVVRDYLPGGQRRQADPSSHVAELEALSPTELVDPAAVARAIGLGGAEHLDAAVAPRGYRLLAKVPRLPAAVVDRLVDHFGGLQQLLSAGIDDLQAVEGVGELRARSVREGLSRLAESSITERYI